MGGISRAGAADPITTRKPRIATLLLAASVSVALWSGPARGDHYDRIVRFDCDPGRKAVHISLLMPYEGSHLGSHDMLFDVLAERPAGLSCRLSSRNIVIAHALSNPQATRDDNLQIFVNSNEVATLSFDPTSNSDVAISETPQGTSQVDQSKQSK